MTTVRVRQYGPHYLVPGPEFEKLLGLARHSDAVEMEIEDDWATADVMRLVEQGGAFDFWLEEGEDVYTENDGEPI